MNGDQLAGVVGIGAAMMLVGSALVARRLPAARTAKLALAWVGIFGVAYLIAMYFT
jgi:hypothetical protein